MQVYWQKPMRIYKYVFDISYVHISTDIKLVVWIGGLELVARPFFFVFYLDPIL